ncbi:Arc family DNA-binding protein [Salmonella enterica]|nr:Arc family DNA-binding protein [Salmonella enterica]
MSRENPQFNVRISPELKKQVVELARKNKRSINAEIVAAIEMALKMSAKVIKHENGDTEVFLTAAESRLLESQLSMIEEVSKMQKGMDSLIETINKLKKLS